MSATNSTPIINLPLFIGTDKPAWLTDWNGAMNIIDSAIAALQTAESGTATSLASLAQSVEALSGTVSQHTTAIQTITDATATNTGSINTITSLIGNGVPTTDDKTLIGAINEIYGEIGGGSGIAANTVTYNNQTSGLTAENVQAAIDELKDDIDDIQPSSAKTLRATSTSGGTWAAQLAELKTVFDTLTEAEKRESYLIRTSNNGKFNAVSANGSFITMAVDNTGVIGISCSIVSSTALSFTGSTGTDVSSTALASSLELYA